MESFRFYFNLIFFIFCDSSFSLYFSTRSPNVYLFQFVISQDLVTQTVITMKTVKKIRQTYPTWFGNWVDSWKHRSLHVLRRCQVPLQRPQYRMTSLFMNTSRRTLTLKNLTRSRSTTDYVTHVSVWSGFLDQQVWRLDKQQRNRLCIVVGWPVTTSPLQERLQQLPECEGPLSNMSTFYLVVWFYSGTVERVERHEDHPSVTCPAPIVSAVKQHTPILEGLNVLEEERGWVVEVLRLVVGQRSVREKEWLETMKTFGISEEDGKRIIYRLGSLLLVRSWEDYLVETAIGVETLRRTHPQLGDFDGLSTAPPIGCADGLAFDGGWKSR